MPEAQPGDPLLDQPRKSNRPIVIVASVVVGACLFGLVLLLVLFDGVAFNSRASDYRDLSFSEYAALGNTDNFAPLGGEHIDFKTDSTSESTQQWWKMAISEPAYRRLVKAEDDRIPNEAMAEYNREMTTGAAEIPAGWPMMETRVPKWWKPPTKGPELEAIRWEIQKPDRGIGRFWVYDRASSTLWIWKWNEQWFRFPDAPSVR